MYYAFSLNKKLKIQVSKLGILFIHKRNLTTSKAKLTNDDQFKLILNWQRNEYVNLLSNC